jgi:phosphinothricin acetyltransferase
VTFDTEPKTVKQMQKWFKEHSLKNPIIVAIYHDLIIGWASLSKYSTRCAYSNTAEISTYVLEDYQNRGVGNKLIEKIIEQGKQVGLHTILARITEGNDISIKLHEKYGFSHIGVLKEVGNKFGKTLDVILMQKIYR